MKKIVKAISLMLSILFIFAFAGCDVDGTPRDGKSAYEIWLEEGHEGSQNDFLEWLRGGKGDKGDFLLCRLPAPLKMVLTA